MNESKLYESLEAALSGAQHIEEIAAGLAPETRNSSESIRDGLEVIYNTVDAVETILFHLLEIHKEEGKTAARIDEIEEAAKAIAIIERPELIPEAVPEGMEIIPDPNKISPEGWKTWKEAGK